MKTGATPHGNLRLAGTLILLATLTLAAIGFY